MNRSLPFLKIHPEDNVLVALETLPKGTTITWSDQTFLLKSTVPTKHKFTLVPIPEEGLLKMYGVVIGKAKTALESGVSLTTQNVVHATDRYEYQAPSSDWQAPNVSDWKNRTFLGYHRSDGRVGTRNHWLVIPLVFCENRNTAVLKDALLEQLGYATDRHFSVNTQLLIEGYRQGKSEADLLQSNILQDAQSVRQNRIFPNVDGIKFLTHDGGCGGIRQDSEVLCRLLAAYIDHPNVAGATVLSLGCQNAQIQQLQTAIDQLNPAFDKPVYYLEQQRSKSERDFIAQGVKYSFVGMMKANILERRPASLHHLTLGLECGGSDGFSGISANPALGHTSDLLVALGGSTILSEFPELNGVEQELINRCAAPEKAHKFMQLMQQYSERAIAVGSGFENNPSPGNIKDGLITDAMKSAGAAKKGGTSPVVDVLDYTEVVKEVGLNLLCTPGNDVESTTGLASAGANLIVFTTGLGTPTGNPIAPVLKMSSNNLLNERMRDIIDFNAGKIITGEATITSVGEDLLELLIQTASGTYTTQAERLGQDDFIPWKRGISL
ncbi:MAG: altronate dehydratase family protein [Bacteroidota bacterium]